MISVRNTSTEQRWALFRAPIFLPLYIAIAVPTLFSRSFARTPLLALYEDDFFYYLKVAQNLVTLHRSTFDGIHLTNGYHPLWAAVLTGLYAALKGRPFFLGLQAITLLAAIACYLGTRAIFDTLGLQNQLDDLSVFAVSIESLVLFRGGMEIILAVPLSIWLVVLVLRPQGSQRAGFATGFLASLVILSRLDAIFLVILLLLARLWASPRSLRLVPSFLAGGFLFPIYLILNQLYFHSALPVSGRAKELRTTYLPSWRGPASLINPLNHIELLFVIPCLLLLVAGCIFGWKARRTIPRNRLAVLWALLLFPIAQLLVLSCVSDWQLWEWYFYPFIFSSIAALALLLRNRSPNTPARFTTVLVGLLVCILSLQLAFNYAVVGPKTVEAYETSARIADFMNMHPGIYAMGDRAGAVGYLSNQPVIQMEGLMMDEEYLKRIRSSEPLSLVMQDYGVKYYVTWLGSQPGLGRCVAAREPSLAGPSSHVLSGKVCGEPVAVFPDSGARTTFYVFRADEVK